METGTETLSIGDTMNVRALEAAVDWLTTRNLPLVARDGWQDGERHGYLAYEAHLPSGELVSLTFGAEGSHVGPVDIAVHEHVDSRSRDVSIIVRKRGSVMVGMNGGIFHVAEAAAPGAIARLFAIRQIAVAAWGRSIVVPPYTGQKEGEILWA